MTSEYFIFQGQLHLELALNFGLKILALGTFKNIFESFIHLLSYFFENLFAQGVSLTFKGVFNDPRATLSSQGRVKKRK